MVEQSTDTDAGAVSETPSPQVPDSGVRFDELQKFDTQLETGDRHIFTSPMLHYEQPWSLGYSQNTGEVNCYIISFNINNGHQNLVALRLDADDPVVITEHARELHELACQLWESKSPLPPLEYVNNPELDVAEQAIAKCSWPRRVFEMHIFKENEIVDSFIADLEVVANKFGIEVAAFRFPSLEGLIERHNEEQEGPDRA